MSVLPNSHEALLKNSEQLSGRLALLGLTNPDLLGRLPGSGVVMTENAGIHARLLNHDSWSSAFGYDDTALKPASADTIVVFLPKSRAEFLLRLSLALWLARQGGHLILVGEKKEGIAGAVRQLREQLPQSEKVDSARHCQVWQARITTPQEKFRLSDWMQWHRVEHEGVSLQVASLPGIFSSGELDAGTAMLLGTLAREPLASGRVLDFACGAGTIGAWWQEFQSRHSWPVDTVDGADVQSQAITCARATYDRAGAQGTIMASDGLPAVEGQYQSVVTNPPFHTGILTDTSVTERFIQGVSRHLVKGGELRLVANRFLPYQALIKRHVGDTKVLAEDNRFVVWSARKS